MRQKDAKKALTVRPPSSNYEVGYGKPPVETRFKPGRSGNPTGRPKGSRQKPRPPALNEERLKGIILEEAYRSIRINDAERQVSIPMAQAIVRSLAVNAAKGNQRAQRLFTELLAATERDNKRLHDEWLETAIEYKVGWEIELDRRKRLVVSASTMNRAKSTRRVRLLSRIGAPTAAVAIGSFAPTMAPGSGFFSRWLAGIGFRRTCASSASMASRHTVTLARD